MSVPQGAAVASARRVLREWDVGQKGSWEKSIEPLEVEDPLKHHLDFNQSSNYNFVINSIKKYVHQLLTKLIPMTLFTNIYHKFNLFWFTLSPIKLCFSR